MISTVSISHLARTRTVFLYVQGLCRRLPLLSIFLLLLTGPCRAQQIDQQMELKGQWYEATPGWVYTNQTTLTGSALKTIAKPGKTGGHFFYEAVFDVRQAQTWVLDFKNSSVVNQFHHRLFDDHGHLVAEAEGGIQSTAVNPFFLRHGREVSLPAGHYRLLTELSSPFLLAQPVPYMDTLAHYRQDINVGNTLTLLCLGVLLALAFYYIALSLIRSNGTDALYCFFIIGNLLYNGTALLLLPQLFGMHWFFMISTPILFSNCAYVFFVLRLLNITRDTHPRLYGAGIGLLILFASFILFAAVRPNWSLELDRFGVALFMSYGLATSLVCTIRQHDSTARNYLIAVLTFFVLGAVSISLSEVSGVYTFYVEHLGLLAVTVEALLLAMVLASQFVQLRRQFEREREYATRDPLTGLQNRRAYLDQAFFEVERSKRYGHPITVMFMDLDNFKQLNDSKGHDAGDAALQEIATVLAGTLRSHDLVARLGGDEFSILLPEIEQDAALAVGEKIFDALQQALMDFSPVTVSIGVVWFNAVDRSFSDMLKVADEVMYEAKIGGKNHLEFRCFHVVNEVARRA